MILKFLYLRIFTLFSALEIEVIVNGEVSERSKEHAWKVCMPLKGIEGSNPFLSAGIKYF
jgi:hypothetical protein